MDLEAVDELVGFLVHKRGDLRAKSVQTVYEYTGTDTGISSLLLSNHDTNGNVCNALLKMIGSDDDEALYAIKALVNLSSNPRARLTLLQVESLWNRLLDFVVELIKSFKKKIKDKNIEKIAAALKLINNLTRDEDAAVRFLHGRFGISDGKASNILIGFELKMLLEFVFELLDSESIKDDNEYGDVIKSVVGISVNVTQTSLARNLILGNDVNLLYFARLALLVIDPKFEIYSLAIKFVRNCCFQTDLHAKILICFKDPTIRAVLGSANSECQSVLFLLIFHLIGSHDDAEPYFPNPLAADQENVQFLDETYPKFIVDRILKRDECLVVQDSETRMALIDCLYLLTDSLDGREEMRKLKLYDIIKKYHPDEENDAISDKVFEVVERILAEEENKLEQKDASALINALNDPSATSGNLDSHVKESENELYDEDESMNENALYDIDE